MSRVRATLMLLAVVALSFNGLAAAEKKTEKKPQPKKTVAITLDEVDADFALQGEYSGTITEDDGDLKLGVQVIALGDGKFQAVGYPGGLPGDGWNKKDKIKADGTAKDGVAKFKCDKGIAMLKDGVLTITSPDRKELGKLKKVTRKSPTLGKKVPEGAVVLFDGSSVDNFPGGKMTKDGLLMQGVASKQKFQSFQLHIEFLLSYMPYARGQGRSNSGCYMQGRYEVQMLDSFGLEGKHNEAGGIYETRDPDVNMCFPPLTWQTYDIDFTAAKYDESGKKTKNATITVQHNGVVVHDNVELPKSTRAAPVKESAEPGPIYIQNHGNPLRFRNIWLVEKR